MSVDKKEIDYNDKGIIELNNQIEDSLDFI